MNAVLFFFQFVFMTSAYWLLTTCRMLSTKIYFFSKIKYIFISQYYFFNSQSSPRLSFSLFLFQNHYYMYQQPETVIDTTFIIRLFHFALVGWLDIVCNNPNHNFYSILVHCFLLFLFHNYIYCFLFFSFPCVSIFFCSSPLYL